MASSSTCSPLRGSWRPMKKMVFSSVGVGVALAYRSTSTPLNTSRNSPPTTAFAIFSASGETAHRTSIPRAMRRNTDRARS